MTKDDFQKYMNLAQPGMFNLVYVDPKFSSLQQEGSILTQFGTGEACHIELVYKIVKDAAGNVIDVLTVAADGTKVCMHSMVKDYSENKEAYELTLMTPDLSVAGNAEKIIKYAEGRINTVYNWDIIKNIASKAALCKIPIAGFFFNKSVWNYNKDNKDMPGTVCSKEGTLYVRQIDPTCRASYDLNSISPELLSQSHCLQPVFRASEA